NTESVEYVFAPAGSASGTSAAVAAITSRLLRKLLLIPTSSGGAKVSRPKLTGRSAGMLDPWHVSRALSNRRDPLPRREERIGSISRPRGNGYSSEQPVRRRVPWRF